MPLNPEFSQMSPIHLQHLRRRRSLRLKTPFPLGSLLRLLGEIHAKAVVLRTRIDIVKRGSPLGPPSRRFFLRDTLQMTAQRYPRPNLTANLPSPLLQASIIHYHLHLVPQVRLLLLIHRSVTIQVDVIRSPGLCQDLPSRPRLMLAISHLLTTITFRKARKAPEAMTLDTMI